MTVSIAIAALTLAVWVALVARASRSHRNVLRLERVAPPGPGDPPLPRLSIVVAAHNEEHLLEEALRSLLALRYPDYEVIVVNDRSTDRTGEIADRLSAEDARLTVLHIDELPPPGWLGKPRAYHRAVASATGEVLLFTDADVVFAPDAPACGVRHLVRERLDHLSALPRLVHTGTVLQACTIAFRLFVHGRQQLWRVQDPRSSACWGCGPYTIMPTDYYRATGGWERVALRPDEDVRLGQFVKASGGRSAFLEGSALLEFAWYHSLGDFVRGLEKNAFASRDYSVPKTIAQVVVLAWLALAPFTLAPWFLWTDQVVAGLLLAACPPVYWWAAAKRFRRDDSYPLQSAILLPAGLLVLAYAVGRSMLLNHLRGVVMGGISIPLAEARAARVRVQASSRDP